MASLVILSWSRSKGLFAGASLEGAVIQASEDANERMYGRPTRVREIVAGNRAVPEQGRSFVSLVDQVANRPFEQAEER